MFNDCKIQMPDKNNILKFENFKNNIKVPFAIYADFECILEKKNKPLPSSEYSHITKEHKPFSVGYYLKCSYDDKLSKYNAYRGENCADWFIKELVGIVNEFENKTNNIIRMNLSDNDQKVFNSALVCHICKESFQNSNIKVRDHFRLTGKFRGAVHQVCNLNYKNTSSLPVVFHNLTNYDGHLYERISQTWR